MLWHLEDFLKNILYFPLISVLFIYLYIVFFPFKNRIKKILMFIHNFEHDMVVMHAHALSIIKKHRSIKKYMLVATKQYFQVMKFFLL